MRCSSFTSCNLPFYAFCLPPPPLKLYLAFITVNWMGPTLTQWQCPWYISIFYLKLLFRFNVIAASLPSEAAPRNPFLFFHATLQFMPVSPLQGALHPFIFQKEGGEGERHSTKQLRDETLPLKPILLQNTLSPASAEDRDVKVKNTKYANHWSVDQSHQNHAIRAEATSSCFPWQMYFYRRQAEKLKVPVK